MNKIIKKLINFKKISILIVINNKIFILKERELFCDYEKERKC